MFADEAGNKYVAIRGSEAGLFTGTQDWLLTNVGDIGNDGIAIYQGIALFNWLQRLYGPPGQPVVQYYYNELTRGVGIGPYATATGALLVVDPVSQNLVPAPVTVTGHSMGGHLAMMMSRLAPGLVDAVYTFNAPGFDTSWRTNLFPLTSDGFFNALINAPIDPVTGTIGTDWDDDKITGWNVDGDVVHHIGDSPGTQQDLFSDSTNEGVYDAHVKEPITDALAIYSWAGVSAANPNVPGGRWPRALGFAALTPTYQ